MKTFVFLAAGLTIQMSTASATQPVACPYLEGNPKEYVRSYDLIAGAKFGNRLAFAKINIEDHSQFIRIFGTHSGVNLYQYDVGIENIFVQTRPVPQKRVKIAVMWPTRFQPPKSIFLLNAKFVDPKLSENSFLSEAARKILRQSMFIADSCSFGDYKYISQKLIMYLKN